LNRLAKWQENLGPLAYRALAVYHFTQEGHRIRADLEGGYKDDFSAFLEASKTEWAQRQPVFRGRSNDASSLRRGMLAQLFLPTLPERGEVISVDELAKEDAENKRNEFVTAALAGLASNGESTDVQFARHYTSTESYDLRLEAVKVITRFGNSSDIPTLLDIAKHSEGMLQEVAARGAMRLNPEPGVAARELLLTGDAILIGIVVQSLLATNAGKTSAEFLESFLDNDKAELRTGVLAYFGEKSSEEELSGLLERYTSRQVYYYDVVCWLDRMLYAPPKLRDVYTKTLKRQLFID
jgi:hypothetical protein